jgi:hypothetical protein
MPTRASVLGGVAVVALGLGFALVPAHGQQIHRHSFAGRQPALVRWDANVRADEAEHDITELSFKSQPSSEHLRVTCEAGTGESPFVHYFYDTPPAPVSEVLSASVWVKATRPGVQLRARVVFPNERDPARPEALLTTLIVGKTYEKTRNWEKLTLEDVPSLVGKSLPRLHAKVNRAVNTTDAYIDRLVLNVYTGPGAVDVWVDDLDIGPVRPRSQPDQGAPGVPGIPSKGTKAGDPPAGKGRLTDLYAGQLRVDGKPHFFRAIRHTGTPLHVLRAAGFDALWLPADTPPELVDEANREGWFVIPSVPPADVGAVTAAPGDGKLDVFRRKFAASDVLFWDLGGGITAEQRARVEATNASIRRGDRRPIGGDLWDGFDAYSQSIDVLGAHRWPLFTSLELTKYRDWLAQRKTLATGRPVFWTWVQDHLPDWYAANVASRPVEQGGNPDLAFADPVGPHPEQVRLLAYISIASGCRGLGFWSDRFLADSHHGRDRLQGMALLNTELDLLTPVLLSAGAAGGKTEWLTTSNPYVKAAVIKGRLKNGRTITLLLPIWFGPGDQYVPAQGAAAGLKVTVDGVSEGQDPWLVTPAGVECLRNGAVRTSRGTELTIDEFDLVSPIVFTDDQTPTGLVVWWQDHARRYGRLSARWALDLVATEYEKVRLVHMRLAERGVEVRRAEDLLKETHRYYDEAQRHFANEVYDRAYRDATRALRPLRVLMRDHWQLATEGLDLPTASPFAVSYFSLPQHWELAREVQFARPSPTLLPYGGFEFQSEIPAEGLSIDRLAGWSARTGTLDRVAVAAGVVRSDGLAVQRVPRQAAPPPRSMFAPSRPIVRPDEGYTPPTPELGRGVLKLEVRSLSQTDANGKPLDYIKPLERTFLAVDSPPVRLPPGTLVRVSGWVRTPREVVGDAAGGVLMYDDAGGEPLAVRLLNTNEGKEAGVWREFHLYRRVPASGQIRVTLALTGLGTAFFDDIRVEPMIAGAGAADAATAGRGGRAAPGVTTAGGGGARAPVVPAGYRPR